MHNRIIKGAMKRSHNIASSLHLLYSIEVLETYIVP